MTTKVSLANFDDTLFSLTQGQIPDAPRITNVIVANVNYAATGGTTLSSNTGGYLKILGSNFITGCQVLVRRGALKSATTVTRIDSTELRAVMPTSNVGLNILFVTNPDGASGLSSITYV
jgi:hypothetical protein